MFFIELPLKTNQNDTFFQINLQLFTIDGADRVDVVYSKDTGVLWVLSFVENKTQSGKVTLYVDAGVATAADGGATNNHASTLVTYIPSSTAVAAGNAVNGTENSSTFATAASWGVAGSLAVSFGAAMISPSGVVGVGAINFAGFAQTFAMSGTLPITNMPSNYRAAANSMEWVALQPKVGPTSTAPSEEEIQQAADLADTSARFPYTPVEVKILPDGNFDPNTNTGEGQTGEIVSIPTNTTLVDSSSGGDGTGAVGDSTGEDGSSTTYTPVLVVVVPLPEVDLVSANGTKPSPFKPKPASGEKTTVLDSGSGEDSSSNPPVQQEATAEDGIVIVESTPPTLTGGIVINPTTPPAPVVQQGGEDSGIIIETPNTPPGSEDTVVVILPGDSTTNSPPPTSKSPPPAIIVPGNSPTTPSNGGAISPTPAPNSNNNSSSPGAAPSPENDGAKDEKGLAPPSPTPPPSTPSGGNGTAQQEATEGSGAIIDIPGAKLPSPPTESPPSSNSSGPSSTPAPAVSKSPAPGPSPAAAASSKSPAPAPSPSKSPSPSPPKLPSPSPPKASPSPSPSPLPRKSPPPPKSPAPIIGERENKDSAEDLDADTDAGFRVVPRNAPKTHNGGRHLLLNDPLAALSSSGFSYVVVTATADGSGSSTTIANGTDTTAGETIGASALSRIRTIQNAGQGPDADAHRLNTLWDVLFWTAIAVVATLVLHLCVLGLIRWAKKPVPKMLHLPRLELLVFMMTLPMIAAAGAGLLKSTSAGVVTLGIVFSIIVPFGFLGLASVFLVKYLLRSAVEQRRALYVLVATADATDGDGFNGEGAAASSSLGSSREGSLTAAMLGPDARDSLAEIGASSSGASTSRAAAPADGEITAAATEQTTSSTTSLFFSRVKSAMYTWVLRPVFGFQDSSAHAEALAITDGAAWLGRGKWDAEFVKRYGCFFEDTHGPQVLRVRSRYDPTSISSSFNSMGGEDVVGTGVLVPATSAGATEGALQALQTFGIIFAVTKMVLFAVIINGPGGVNNLGQVMALLVVALMHIVYLRLCHPYRLRIELAAEMVASTCDLAIFACGIALIAKTDWSESEKESMGIAMLALQAVGFLIFISVRVGLALRTTGKTVGPALKHLWPKKLTWSGRNARTTSDAQFLASTSTAT